MQGYIAEIFSSFQGEGGSVNGSCFGKRQIFVRLAGCDLALAGSACAWCDTPSAWEIELKSLRAERIPGKRDFETIENPVKVEKVSELVKKLKTNDLHSISFTGGEPLLQLNFLEALAKELKKKYRLYIETSGTLPMNAKKVAKYFDYACVDIKDRSAGLKGMEEIVEKEFKTMKILKEAGASVFAKVVVTQETRESNMRYYAKKLGEIGIALAIQPVTLPKSKGKRIKGIEMEKLFRLSEAAGEYLNPEEITISFQMHKALGIL